jgi:hypothetical protein
MLVRHCACTLKRPRLGPRRGNLGNFPGNLKLAPLTVKVSVCGVLLVLATVAEYAAPEH